MKFTSCALISLLCLLLIACGGGDGLRDGMTPLPTAVAEPTNAALAEAVTKILQQKNAPPNSAYDFERIDLNGDGRRDAIVLFKLPHSYWCGWDGCGMAIFKANEKTFSYVSSTSGVRGPLYVTKTGSNGWRDIAFRISGTNIKDKNVFLKYDGRGYPASPLLAPTLFTPLSLLKAEKILR